MSEVWVLWAAIEHDVAQLQQSTELTATSKGGVDFLIQPASERLPKTDSKGRLTHETQRWVEITNMGNVDAEENVVVEPVPGLNFGLHWPGPTTIQHGQTRKAPITYSMATSRAAVAVRWIEAGVAHSQEFDID